MLNDVGGAATQLALVLLHNGVVPLAVNHLLAFNLLASGTWVAGLKPAIAQVAIVLDVVG